MELELCSEKAGHLGLLARSQQEMGSYLLSLLFRAAGATCHFLLLFAFKVGQEIQHFID